VAGSTIPPIFRESDEGLPFAGIYGNPAAIETLSPIFAKFTRARKSVSRGTVFQKKILTPARGELTTNDSNGEATNRRPPTSFF
jgi:hypothetical protein